MLGFECTTRFVLDGACNSWSEDDDRPYFEILQIVINGRAEDTEGGLFVNGATGTGLEGQFNLTNATFQILDGREQGFADSSADTCNPSIVSGTPIRVQSYRQAPTSVIMLRRMGTSTSFGCYLAVDAASGGGLKSDLLGSGTDSSPESGSGANRFELHSIDSAPSRLLLNGITITTNNTVPPQVRWFDSVNAISNIGTDQVDVRWVAPSSLGGPPIERYTLKSVGVVHQITSIDMRSIRTMTGTDQFQIGSESATAATTGCLAWDSTAAEIKTALLSSNVTGYHETRSIHVTRQSSDVQELSYKWIVTFIRSTPINLTASFGESTCTKQPDVGIQADVWIEMTEVRPRSIHVMPSITGIQPTATSHTITGLLGFSSYFFTITASNILGTSLTSLKLATTTGVISVPATITSIPTSTSRAAVDLVFSWNEHPNDGGQPIDGYLISCQKNTSADISSIKEVVAFRRTFILEVADDSSNSPAIVGTIQEPGTTVTSTISGDIDKKDLSSLVATDGTNQLHEDVILSFEVMCTDLKFIPSRFEHTSVSTPNNGIFFVYLPSPSTVSIALMPCFKQRLKSSGP